MHTLTMTSFLFFMALVGIITWRVTRKDDHSSSSGYFLGGRSLSFPLIAGSLLLTNLSTEQMVGLNGAAFTDGLCVMVWEVVAVVVLVEAEEVGHLRAFLQSLGVDHPLEDPLRPQALLGKDEVRGDDVVGEAHCDVSRIMESQCGTPRSKADLPADRAAVRVLK